ncbi:ECF-type sigma factor [Ideonella sp.]|uniref:ECF-type sigma factor n=1 Tax=Ideonella sp. TaxID=1929293 RepID=UPI0035B3B5B2
MPDLSLLIDQVANGSHEARHLLFAAAYGELHQLARARLRRCGHDPMLDATTLVHESYLRFLTAAPLRRADRRTFFAYASQVMRSVITDAARSRWTERRGGGDSPQVLDDDTLAALPAGHEQGQWVHEALAALEAVEPRLAQVVHLRCFGGYEEREIGAALGLHERTVRRDWRKACRLLKSLIRN